MSYRHTIEATLESLHEIEDLVKKFPDDGKIPSIEIDLALQKLRNLYELMLMIRDRDDIILETTEIDVSVEKLHEKPADTDETILLKNKQGAVEEKHEIRNSGDSKIMKDNHENGSNLQIKTEIKKTTTVTETLADHFKGSTTLLESLHQTINKESKDFAHKKPVVDLMSAIAINDRFTFIRELFNNDIKVFESSLVVLNNAKDFNDAYNYLIQQFSWDMDSEPVQQLLDIIRRKFIGATHE